MADILEELNVPKEKKKREDLFLEKKHVKQNVKQTKESSPAFKNREERLKTSAVKQEGKDRKEVVLRFRMPKPITIERCVYILIILVLAYFVFINDDVNFKGIMGVFTREGNVSSYAASDAKIAADTGTTEETSKDETADTAEDTSEETTEETTEVEETTPALSGKIVLVITDVDTAATSYGGKKITGVDYSIDNQNETISAELKIFVYEPGDVAGSIARTKSKETVTYSTLVASLNKITGSKALNVPPPANPNKMKVDLQLFNKKTGKMVANEYKLVDVSQ